MPDRVQISKAALLTVAQAAIYTADFQRWFTVMNIHLVNTTNVAATVRVCLVPAASTPLQTNALIWDYSLPSNTFLELGEGIKVPPRSFIYAAAGAANSVNIVISGFEE